MRNETKSVAATYAVYAKCTDGWRAASETSEEVKERRTNYATRHSVGANPRRATASQIIIDDVGIGGW